MSQGSEVLILDCTSLFADVGNELLFFSFISVFPLIMDHPSSVVIGHLHFLQRIYELDRFAIRAT